MLIDTHAHIMFPEFDEDRVEVIKRAKGDGLKAILNVGCGIESSRQSLEMAQKDDSGFLYSTLGLHPYDAAQMTDELLKQWENWILEDKQRAGAKGDHRKIVAIGETGLDYFKAQVDNEIQKKSFRKQVELAVRMRLPVIVHNRQADEDCLGILQEFQKNGDSVPGNESSYKQRVFPEDNFNEKSLMGDKGCLKAVFHCYGSTLEFARRLWEAGFMTSFTGIITFPSAESLREVIKEMPLDKFMLETDCPYLAPQAYRGKRNEPAYIVEIAKMIAEVKEMSFEEISDLSLSNTIEFFDL